jgi:hypothetical protein
VGQRDALAADRVTRGRAQEALRFDACELGALYFLAQPRLARRAGLSIVGLKP